MANLLDQQAQPYAPQVRKLLEQLTNVELATDIDPQGQAAISAIRQQLVDEHKRAYAMAEAQAAAQQLASGAGGGLFGPPAGPMGGSAGMAAGQAAPAYAPSNVLPGYPMPSADELNRTRTAMGNRAGV